MATKPEDFPLVEVAAACETLVNRGAFILQKWTCDSCGQRVTSQNVNVLTHHGHCQHCNHVTNLDQRGCNYAVIQCSIPITALELERMLGLVEPGVH